MTMFQPFSASRTALAAPMPDPEPVMIATLFAMLVEDPPCRAAVDGDNLTRDRRCVRRSEEEHDRRDVLGLDEAADRELLDEALLSLGLAHADLLRPRGQALRIAVGLGERRVDGVRRDALGGDRLA